MVLLDEVEKAAPEVFDILLQAVRRRPADRPAGPTEDFRKLLMLNSNLGSPAWSTLRWTAAEGRGADGGGRQAFRPEFVNRLDAVVLFDALGKDELARSST